MITKFDTSGMNDGGSKKGGIGIVTIIGVLVAGFLVYKFVLKPRMDKNKNQNETN